MPRKLLPTLLLALSAAAPAQQSNPQPTSTGLKYVRESVLAERDFPFLAGLEQDIQVHSLLNRDAALSSIAAERWQAVDKANADCKEDIHCKAKALKFDPQQTSQVSAVLRTLYERSDVLRQYVHRTLEDKPEYTLDPAAKGADLLVANWERSARALDQIIATYGEGVKPRYPDIDSITYDANSHTYAALIRVVLDGLRIPEEASSPATEKPLFFDPALRFALRLLQANSRDEAGRLWPLETGENSKAIARAKTLQWSKFPYTVILIPGSGSEVPGVSLSPWGRERIRLGIAAYRAGLAPFIMISGGFVHPSQTPFCEALEMKRYLMQVYGLPENAIIVEPYARHTTTNLRNGVREIIHYGIPTGKPLLIVSDTSQSDYMAGEAFTARNQQELGYQPAKLGKRLSPTQQEAIPSAQSLFRDPLDPLDP